MHAHTHPLHGATRIAFRRARVSALRSAAAATAGVLLLGSPSALAVVGDFNGDGIGDVAVGIPAEGLVSGTTNHAAAGAVNVIYGTAASGLRAASSASTPTNQLWHQNVAGIADSAEANDRFGAGVAAGDFNGDGVTDLAIAVPGDDAIHVIPGSAATAAAPGGLTATGSQLLLASQFDDANGQALHIGGSSGAPAAVALAVGDFNRDGFDDLAIEGWEFGSTEFQVSKVAVLSGAATGLTSQGSALFAFTNNQQFNGDGDLGNVKVALASGDIDADGDDDLAVGLPFSNLAPSPTGLDAGRVGILLGRVQGISAVGFFTLTQATGGGETVEPGDHFGATLAMGDFDGDGRADLAAATPDEDRDANFDEGSVSVFSAAATLQSTWNGGALALPRGTGDRFGTALAAADFNGDGRDDLALGIPGQFTSNASGDNAGSVSVVYGGSTGLAVANLPGPQSWRQGNLLSVAEPGDLFGAALSAGNLGRSTNGDLVIGAPGEDLSVLVAPPLCVTKACMVAETRADAGQLNVAYGSALGLAVTGAQAFTQNTASIADSVEAGDQYGSAQ